MTKLIAFDFDLGDITFTAGMDKRLSPGPFYTAPIVQGDLDGTGVPDIVLYPQGTQLGNTVQDEVYANFDAEQGTIVLWITPEWDPGDGVLHYFFRSGGTFYLRKSGTDLQFRPPGGLFSVDISGWTAGTTYCVICRWDSKNTLDGTNYASISINDSHTYGATSSWSATTVYANLIVGGESIGGGDAADSIIEGLTIYRRILFDGTYGVDAGNGDELALIYAAGAGSDPTLITGSWDVVFCLPTNSTAEELTTGTEEAWTHPHGSDIIDVWGNWDGGLPGTPFAVEFDGAATNINCGSGATLDDLAVGATITVEAWIRAEGWGENSLGRIVDKGSSNSEGWVLHLWDTAGVRFLNFCATTNADARSGTDEFSLDGKWHHIVVVYDDAGDRKPYIAIDGRWVSSYATQTAGVGAATADATRDLVIGNSTNGAFTFDGGQAWVAIYNAAQYTVGTDFIPPRTAPAPGGNLVESWHLDEGTGATAAAQVTTPGNDGTITSGTWSSIWEQELTPVIPQSLEFAGNSTSVDCGSAAALDDIPAGGGDLFVEAWVRWAGAGESAFGGIVADKGAMVGLVGWQVSLQTTRGLNAYVYCDTTDAWSYSGIDDLPPFDNLYHHVAMHYDDTTKTIRLWIDGIEPGYSLQQVGAGAYTSDAAQDLTIGDATGGGFALNGALSYVRISDNVRYAADFVPTGRPNPPATDGNTVVQYNFTDGAGTTLTDAVGPGTNNGTITMGSGRWYNTPDMSIDEPGARVFSQGYNIGSDAADDGLTDIETVTAETDYVLRAVISYGQSGRAWPEIYIYDNTGAAQIGADYDLPRLTDVHTGANNSATLINANGAFTQQLVGWTAYNITDGSSTVITAVSGDKTTITGVLAGGTDNDWDTNDVYILRPPNDDPYCRHPVATEAIFVFRTPAGCVSIDIKVRNDAAEGVMQVHQVEVLESLIDNGDHESLTGGNPDLITGWTNAALDVGDTEAEVVVVHAGTQSLEWNTGASGEGMYITPTLTIDKFFSIGFWSYGDGTARIWYQTTSALVALVQSSNSTFSIDGDTDQFWHHTGGVMRAVLANPRFYLVGSTGGVGDRYSDDAYMVECDDVSLTVTPASEANSLEGAGIRVDGRDTCTQPIPGYYLTNTRGWIRWNVTFRHDAAELGAYGTAGAEAYYGDFTFDATRRIAIYSTTVNLIDLWFNDGGGAHTNNWNCTGLIVAGTTYLFEVRYSSGWMRLYVDGVQRIEIVTPINFTAIPNTADWGSNFVAARQGDVVFSPP